MPSLPHSVFPSLALRLTTPLARFLYNVMQTYIAPSLQAVGIAYRLY